MKLKLAAQTPIFKINILMQPEDHTNMTHAEER